MKKKTIIGIIGEQAGGKGAAADIIRKHYGGSRLTISSMLRRTLDSLHLEATRDNLINLALVLKQGFNNQVLMEAMLKEVEQEDTDLVIVDGLRMPGDPDPFRREYGDDFKLIYVTADPKVRHQRSVERGEKVGENEATYREFIAKEKKDTEKDISEVGAAADFKIINNSDVKNLEKQIVSIMNKM